MGHGGATTDRLPRRLGLLGGMAWPSTLEAYRQLNESVHAALGGVHSADLVIHSFDFAQIEQLQAAGAWDAAGEVLGAAAKSLGDAGAEAILLCTNTMHRVADSITSISGLPIIHIADVTAAAVIAAGVTRVGLLGTAFTMEGAFYAGRLRDHGLDVVVPSATDRQLVHDVIYHELVNGVISDRSRARYLEVIDRLVSDGAEGIIAGCTEIELLVRAADVGVAWFPTTALHVAAAAAWTLGGDLPAGPDALRSVP